MGVREDVEWDSEEAWQYLSCVCVCVCVCARAHIRVTSCTCLHTCIHTKNIPAYIQKNARILKYICPHTDRPHQIIYVYEYKIYNLFL